MSLMRTGWMLLAAILAAAPAAAQNAPPPGEKAPPPPIRIEWRDQPSFRAGVFRLDVDARGQSDFRTADQELADEGGVYETALKRVGVAGRITNRVEFEIERELRKQNPWRNVFVNVRVARELEVRVGKFKMPFSYEELTSVTRLDFAYRTLLAQIISPAREVGVMAHGEVLR